MGLFFRCPATKAGEGCCTPSAESSSQKPLMVHSALPSGPAPAFTSLHSARSWHKIQGTAVVSARACATTAFRYPRSGPPYSFSTCSAMTGPPCGHSSALPVSSATTAPSACCEKASQAGSLQRKHLAGARIHRGTPPLLCSPHV